MDSNTHSNLSLAGPLFGWPADLPAGPAADPRAGPPDAFTAALMGLAAEDLDRVSDAALNQDLDRLQRQLNGLQGQWLRRLAALDACGAAGADQDQPARSTAGWLRRRLRLSAAAAHSSVRTARALFGGRWPGPAQALVAGELSAAHAAAVVDGTHQLPGQGVVAAEPVLVAGARRLDPPQLRRLAAHLVQVADPEGVDRLAARRPERRGGVAVTDLGGHGGGPGAAGPRGRGHPHGGGGAPGPPR